MDKEGRGGTGMDEGALLRGGGGQGSTLIVQLAV